jgi:long-chain acyl-CoA synthetase
MAPASDIIDPKTAKTIAGMFSERVRRTPRACAYRRFNEEERRFETITWEEVSNLAARWQAALAQEGLLPGDRVAVGLRNCLEWVLFDLAALGLGLVTVPLFAGDQPANSAYILEATGSRLVLIEDGEQWLNLRKAGKCLPEVERVVTLRRLRQAESRPDTREPSEPETGRAQTEARLENANEGGISEYPAADRIPDPRLAELMVWLPDQGGVYAAHSQDPAGLATIVYTSGTTGMPKGVMLSHANILENAFACLQREFICSDDVFLAFLPLAHTLERTVGYYIPMMSGACVAYARSVEKLSDDFLEVRPTVLISVPRIYERIHKKILAALEEKPALVRYLFHLTVHTGWKRFLRLQKRGRWTPGLLLWPFLKRTIANRLASGFGGRLRVSISGGAPMAFPITRVFIGLGLNLLQGYGLTETSPVISFNTTDDNVPGTVGRPLPGVEPAIAANGELLVRGPNIMLGYWQSAQATSAAIDSNGFFHTGDLARMDENGHITISGRLKEIIVLSTGEKVSPENLETAIAVDPLFEQVMVVGEGRPYLAALVVLNRPRWEKLVAEEGIVLDPLDSPANDRIERILLPRMARRLTRFPQHAQIRRVHPTLVPWRTQEGLLTTTLKLRRKELLSRFQSEVESLFKGH